jgi:hypothetical protein
MSDWKKVITSGSDAELNSLYAPSITGSLHGTASWAQNSLTASYSPNLTISGSITSVNYIDFNTGSAQPAWKSGRVFWDNVDGALSVYNAEADVTLQVGQENWTRVRNNTGTTVTNGTVVRLNGAQGDVPTVERAQSLAMSGSVNVLNQILGVATHNIEDNSFGYITTQGLVRGLNTNAFNDGDTLFVGTGSSGILTNIPPRAPYEIIPVGVCVKASPGTSGIIYVAVQQPIDFSDLSSVRVTGSYSYGDLWVYKQSGSFGVWEHTDQLSGSYGITGSLIISSSNNTNDFRVGAKKLFVSASGNVGIGTTTPTRLLQVENSQSILFFDPTSTGGDLRITGSTGVPRMSIAIPASASRPLTGFQLGMRTWGDTSFTGYGKVGDSFFYAGAETNGFNIINPVGTETEDYIRFYAGQFATGTADIHIQGTGSTRGNVGIGKETPNAKLDVLGNTTITGSLTSTQSITGSLYTRDLLTIAPTSPLPTVTNGAIAFSSSGDFYFGSGSAWRKLTL